MDMMNGWIDEWIDEMDGWMDRDGQVDVTNGWMS